MVHKICQLSNNISLFLSFCVVIQFAKKTGDYSVLSHADLSVLALTYNLHIQAEVEMRISQEVQCHFYFCAVVLNDSI